LILSEFYPTTWATQTPRNKKATSRATLTSMPIEPAGAGKKARVAQDVRIFFLSRSSDGSAGGSPQCSGGITAVDSRLPGINFGIKLHQFQ
jgi:hypothetical protein